MAGDFKTEGIQSFDIIPLSSFIKGESVSKIIDLFFQCQLC